MVIGFRPDTHGKILLVGKDKKKSISELVLVEHTLQLLASLDDTVTIVAVNNEDDTLSVLEVMSPQRSNLVLSSDIPYSELNVLVLDSLDVEACVAEKIYNQLCDSPQRRSTRSVVSIRTDCRDSGDDLAKLELIENGSLSGSVKSNHQDSHLLLSPESVEQS